MKLPVIAILLLFSATALAKPVNTHYLPKEYYQRQNLPERPGYIPVYIKHDEPLIKWDSGSDTRVSDQSEKNEEHSAELEDEKTDNIPEIVPEKAQSEQKSKTKKVTENSQSQKRKENKE
ncbi:UNVERIFIED_CONTAM: hypothetical protein PYX00_010682 [Menopon gallinae]|uniref:Secreted protein n=1 Tax=Menopon gallinae TaxID=328185 RepID=A0AAW2HGD6_9NEOP